MRSVALTSVLVLIAWAGCKGGSKTARSALATPADVASIHMLLNKDCATGDPDSVQVVAQLGKMGEAALPVLWDALRHGPSPAERQAASVQAKGEFARMGRFLKSGGLAGPGNEQARAAAMRLDENTYVALQVDALVQGFHEHALGALVALRAPGLPDSLRSLLQEPSVPLVVRERIREILMTK